MRSALVNFRLEDLAPEVEARMVNTGRGGYVDRLKGDLRRYYNLLREELAGLNFTEAEAYILVTALRNVTYVPAYPALLRQAWAPVADAVERPPILVTVGAATWDLREGPGLIAKMRALTPGQVAAVLDAVERYYHQPERGADALRLVGLLR